MLSREIAHSMRVTWNEYWDFLGCYCDLSQPEGLDKLEQYLAQLSEEICSFHCPPRISVTPSHSQSEGRGETLFRSLEPDLNRNTTIAVDDGFRKPSTSHRQPSLHPMGVADTVSDEENLPEGEESPFPSDVPSPRPPPSSPYSPSLAWYACNFAHG